LENSEESLENLAGEKEMKKKCSTCGEVKSLKDYYKTRTRKNGHSQCKGCERKWLIEYRNTEIGFLKHRYDNMRRNSKTQKHGRKNKCFFTFNEFLAAFKKHKSIYGMKSAWGPGIDHLEQHLPITMITQGTKRANGKTPREWSNLSADRLNSNRDYTLQNLIFMRNDENKRKSNSSYEDCKIQIKLYDERFINMESK